MEPAATYTNPVWDGYFADPFVLELEGVFYAYGTRLKPVDGLQFEVLTSEDLVHWRSLGGALEPVGLPETEEYWAPEVAEHGGTFYMYYSAGIKDKHQRLRVAIADRPEGPFRDTGRLLTGDVPFSIDAHPFRDDDGSWYLYYARDFLDGDLVGTAPVVDRLVDMLTLEGTPRTVARATADWQLYQRGRPMYGRVVDWYTLEGPFTRKHDGRYHCFYSGGAWRRPSYGVSYVVADSPMGPFYPPPGDPRPTILKTVPDRVIGPGHNSVVRGPDGSDYIIYHAWDPAHTARRMFVDRLDWTADGPTTRAPTYTPQPVPLRTSD